MDHIMHILHCQQGQKVCSTCMYLRNQELAHYFCWKQS